MTSEEKTLKDSVRENWKILSRYIIIVPLYLKKTIALILCSCNLFSPWKEAFNNVAIQIIFLFDHLVSNIGWTILRRSVDLGSSFRGRRTSSALHDEVIVWKSRICGTFCVLLLTFEVSLLEFFPPCYNPYLTNVSDAFISFIRKSGYEPAITNVILMPLLCRLTRFKWKMRAWMTKWDLTFCLKFFNITCWKQQKNFI